jgi:hypothetical protein
MNLRWGGSLEWLRPPEPHCERGMGLLPYLVPLASQHEVHDELKAQSVASGYVVGDAAVGAGGARSSRDPHVGVAEYGTLGNNPPPTLDHLLSLEAGEFKLACHDVGVVGLRNKNQARRDRW